MRIAGIDPGLDGAIAVFDGESLEIHDLPMLTISGGRKTRRILNPESLSSLLLRINPSFVYVENVHTMPKQGIVSSGRLMETFGIIRGVLGALQLPRAFVEPRTWKRRFALIGKRGKDDSRRVAIDLFPSVSFHRAKDHNRAEAALIAFYGREKHTAAQL
jgi:crossover junction endodeoxyribonuclease RuvC